jgi:hypothetical protein
MAGNMPQFRISVKWNILWGRVDGSLGEAGVLPDGSRLNRAGKVNSSFRLSVKFYLLSSVPWTMKSEAPIVFACCLIVTGIALFLSGIVAFGFHRNSLHSMALL